MSSLDRSLVGSLFALLLASSTSVGCSCKPDASPLYLEQQVERTLDSLLTIGIRPKSLAFTFGKEKLEYHDGRLTLGIAKRPANCTSREQSLSRKDFLDTAATLVRRGIRVKCLTFAPSQVTSAEFTFQEAHLKLVPKE